MSKPVRPRLAARTRPPRRVGPGVECLEERCVPAVDTVLNLNAGGAGSLSAVLAAAAAGDTIVFAPGLSGTITPSAALTVANNVTIQGPGSDVISVSGGKAHQVFLIKAGVSATISGLTITDGSLATDASLNLFGGGAIDNEGNLALVGDVVSNSMAAGDFVEGGGIFSNSNGSLSLVNCLVSGNTASTTGIGTAEGGGIGSFGSLSLVNCIVSGNTATGSGIARGGGIGSFGPVLSVSGCTFTGNQATSDSGGTQGGGLVDLSRSGSIVNTVFANNTASSVTTGGGSTAGGGYINIGSSITTLTNVTFSGNTASTSAGNAEGGGFEFDGVLGTFTNVNVTGNTASATDGTLVSGGGANLHGTVNWTGGLISGNTATSGGSGPGQGGGLWIGGTTTLTGLTVTDNTASNTGSGKAAGGGIVTQEFTALSACTVSGNHATANSGTAKGGGILSFVSLTVTASTIADNGASSTTNDAQGGGIWSDGAVTGTDATLAVTNVTLFGNSVTSGSGTAEGGGIFNSSSAATLLNDTLASNNSEGKSELGYDLFNDSTLNVTNTIVYDPDHAPADPDVSGSITTSQNSLFSSTVPAQMIAANGDLGGNQFGVNPRLGPLADNGGPTQTMALLPGSPALDAGTDTSPLGGIPTTDQRGLPRLQGAATDIGAFEVQPSSPPPAPSQAPAAALPQVFAFLVPAPGGRIGLTGFVFDPDNLLEAHTVVIDWHDGTMTTLMLPADANLFGGGTFSFFPKQTHKKHHHRMITVYVMDAQVRAELAAGGGVVPHVDLRM
jgi:hypothetical protein